MFEAVIFDMDGVIIDSEIVYFELLRNFLKERGYDIPDAQLYRIVGLSSAQSDKLLNELCRTYGTSDVYPVTNVWDAYMEACEGCEIAYENIRNPGVKELLEFLKVKGIKTGLASASDMKDIRQVLEGTGLNGYFDSILSGEMFRESKPNPEIYCRAMQELQTVPSKCIIIEDSAYGITAGKAAGAYVIAKEEKRFGFAQNEADQVIPDLNQMKHVMNEMLDK